MEGLGKASCWIVVILRYGSKLMIVTPKKKESEKGRKKTIATSARAVPRIWNDCVLPVSCKYV